ncbi:MAG: hypothetical protein QXE81_06625 [Desulfurococcaceae archaeon]
MSEYLKQLKIHTVSKISGIKFHDISPVEISIMKEGFPEVKVRDERDYVTVKYGDQVIRYDKWYTKPEHLAEMLKVYYTKQASPP